MNKPLAHHETIVPREHLDFRIDETIPRYWFRNDPYKTRFFDAVQSGFPDGERYFITSVRAFRDRIDDPTMRHEVRDFMRQEGQHGLAHTRYNQMLERQGLPMAELIEDAKEQFDSWTRKYSPEFNVANTAAVEHFTATMAFAYFAKASVMDGAEPRIKALFAWHAIEEMEHKSVAYDVMKKVAKVGYFKRAAAMAFAMKNMVDFTYRYIDRMLAADGFTRWQRLRMHARNFLWIHGPRKGVYGSLTGKLLVYFKPGFHPTQEPTIHNYRNWLEAWERTQDPFVACDALCAAAWR